MGVPLPPAKYTTLDERNRFAQELLERVGGLPGVEAATFGLPFGGPQSPFTIAGQAPDESKRIGMNLVGADHLRMFGIPLRRGRMFDASEVRRGDRVAVINESRGEALARGRESDWRAAATRRFSSVRRRGVWPIPLEPPEVTIIGVIADTRNAGLRADPQPTVVMPYSVVAPASAHARGAQLPGIPTCCSTPCARRCARWIRISRSAVRSRSANCRARRSSSRGSRWRCSARSRRWASRSRPPASTASCRSTSRAARTSWACAWRSARLAATCSV